LRNIEAYIPPKIYINNLKEMISEEEYYLAMKEVE